MKSFKEEKSVLELKSHTVKMETAFAPTIRSLHQEIMEKKISLPEATTKIDNFIKTHPKINKYEKCALLEISLHIQQELKEQKCEETILTKLNEIKSIFPGYYINKETLPISAKIKLAYIRLVIADLRNYINLTGLDNFNDVTYNYLNDSELKHSQEAKMLQAIVAQAKQKMDEKTQQAHLATLKSLVDKKFTPAYIYYVRLAIKQKKPLSELLPTLEYAAEKEEIQAQYSMGELSSNEEIKLLWFNKSASAGSESALEELIHIVSFSNQKEDQTGVNLIKSLEREALTGINTQLKYLFTIILFFSIRIELTHTPITLKTHHFLQKFIDNTQIRKYLMDCYKNSWQQTICELECQIAIRKSGMGDMSEMIKVEVDYDSLINLMEKKSILTPYHQLEKQPHLYFLTTKEKFTPLPIIYCQLEKLKYLYSLTYNKKYFISKNFLDNPIWQVVSKALTLGRGSVFFEKLIQERHLFFSLFPSFSNDIKNLAWIKHQLQKWDAHFKQKPREEAFIQSYSLMLSQEFNDLIQDIDPRKKSIFRKFLCHHNFSREFKARYHLTQLDEKHSSHLETTLDRHLRLKYSFFQEKGWVPPAFESKTNHMGKTP